MNVHILGATRMGKSKFMELAIREHIKRREPFAVIDPHGNLFRDVLRFCAYYDHPIHLFEAGDHFNPLQGDDTSFVVDGLLKCFAQVWKESRHETPLLSRCLRAVLWALHEQKMTLDQAFDIINDPEHVEVHDPLYAQEWQYLRSLPAREYNNHFLSVRNRLMEFLSAPILREMFSKDGLDVNDMLGSQLLVNLESDTLFSEDNSRLVGLLLVNAFFTNAKRGLAKPFTLYIDEAHLFLTPTIAAILSQAQKWGLNIVLAHQHLAQFPDDIRMAILGNAQRTVVFGGLSLADAELMAETLYLGHIDLEEPKTSLIRPTLVGHEKESISRDTFSYTQRRGELQYDKSIRETVSDDEGHQTVYDERLVPIYEELPTSVFSLQEQIHKLAGAIVNQSQGECIVRETTPRRYRVPHVEEPRIGRERIERFKQHAKQTLRARGGRSDQAH